MSRLVSRGNRPPSLTAVLVGDDKASRIFVGNKMKAAEKCGLRANLVQRDSTLSQEELLELLDELGRDGEVREGRREGGMTEWMDGWGEVYRKV